MIFITRFMNSFLHQASFATGYWYYDRHRSVRLVILVGLAIDQIAQSGLSSLSVIYYSAQLFSADSNDDMAHAGFQLRNLEKLLRAGEISRKQHQRFILPLMLNRKNEISRLNGEYKRTSDYIKNTAANVQQQVGRIERAWREVPNAEIHLDAELAKDLSRFASLPIYTSNRRQLSALNRQLLDTLRERDELTQNNFFSQLMTPTQPGKLAVDYIDQRLVPAIRLLREQSTPRDDIPLLWRQLGKAVLQHDLAWKPGKNAFDIDLELYKWACFEKPKLANTDGKIWYSPQTWQFFDKTAEGLRQYNPQKLYQYIQRHPVITDWFNRKGYRTLMNPLMILVKIIKLRWIHILSYDQMVSRKINNQTTRCANSIFYTTLFTNSAPNYT
ncbi:Uncharacterised protein [Citrobacter freundii]|nr:Uncharacterised protein [Citrobacter freundii]